MMKLYEIFCDEFTLSNDHLKLQVDKISDFLRKSYWAPNRSREDVEATIEYSQCYGIYVSTHQVAFARCVTDFVCVALIMDVYVEEAYRGRGLGKWLVDCILNDPNMNRVKKWTLNTNDAHGLYEKCGFRSVTTEESQRHMVRTKIDHSLPFLASKLLAKPVQVNS